MTTTCLLPDCGRPASGGFVCSACMTRHDTTLVELDDLAHALDAAFLKQQRFSVKRIMRLDDRTEDQQDEAPLPFDAGAGRVRRRLSRVLLDVVGQVAAHHPSSIDLLGYPTSMGYAPSKATAIIPTVAAMTGYLRRHRRWFATTPAGADAVAKFERLRADALAVVDRPPDLVFLGVCSRPAKEGKPFEVRRNGQTYRYDECPEDLYGEPDKPTATCPRCKHEWPVEYRRTVLLDALNDQLAPAVDISRGLHALGLAVTAERIRQWKARKRLVDRRRQADIDAGRGVPLYRVGDVIDLVLADVARNPQPSKEEPA